MTSSTSKGQALPEYVLTLAVLVLVAHAGVKAWQSALARAESKQAWYFFLPSP